MGETFRNRTWIRRLTGILLGVWFAAMAYQPAQASVAAAPAQYNLEFGWNASQSPAVVGYKLYYGTASGVYTSVIDLGNTSSVSVPGLASGVTYYFAIAAYGPDGVEGPLSSEIIYVQYVPAVQALAATAGKFTLTLSGPPGQAFEVEATTDFQTWTTIGTVTLDATGAMNFDDTNAPAFSTRFYRTLETP